MNGKLIQRGDYLYVETREPMASKPMMAISRWRVVVIDGDYEIGQDLYYSSGIWIGGRAKVGTVSESEGETIPIPCPRTKLQTRWSERGYWQKYTASKGWVMA